MCCVCKQTCYDDMNYRDYFDDNCASYTAYPEYCGYYDLVGSSSMKACCACVRDSRTIPVVRISPAKNENGVVMCSYLPD